MPESYPQRGIFLVPPLSLPAHAKASPKFRQLGWMRRVRIRSLCGVGSKQQFTLPRLSLQPSMTPIIVWQCCRPLQMSGATQPTMAWTSRGSHRTVNIGHGRQQRWGFGATMIFAVAVVTHIAPGQAQAGPTSPTAAPVTSAPSSSAPSFFPTSSPTFQGCSFPSNIPNGQRIGGSDNAP